VFLKWSFFHWCQWDGFCVRGPPGLSVLGEFLSVIQLKGENSGSRIQWRDRSFSFKVQKMVFWMYFFGFILSHCRGSILTEDLNKDSLEGFPVTPVDPVLNSAASPQRELISLLLFCSQFEPVILEILSISSTRQVAVM